MYTLELEGISVASYKTIYFHMGIHEHKCIVRADGTVDAVNTTHPAAPAGHTWYEVWYGGRGTSSDVELFSAPSYHDAVKHFLQLAKMMDGRAFNKGTGRIKADGHNRSSMPLDKFMDYWENIVMAA